MPQVRREDGPRDDRYMRGRSIEGAGVMAELKPCPFCGGEAEWDEKNKAPQCWQCKATIPSADGILRKYFDKSGYRQYTAMLWNRRADNGNG